MLNPNLAPLGHYTFARLNEILADVIPRSNELPILFSIGEPQKSTPTLLAENVAGHNDKWNRYPPPNGDEAFRSAVVAWAHRRFNLPAGFIDPHRHIVPVPGTREPLYQIGFLCTPLKKASERPAVLMPNPFYHVYQGAAMVGGAEPVYLAAERENNFLPDLGALSEDLLARTSIFFICTPANPQGTIADIEYLKRAIELARQYDFVLALDECYCEIYRGSPPIGGLEACAALDDSLKNVVMFHSLSKRSSAPGLRSGFLCGDPRIIERYSQFVTFGGSPLPLPVLHASTALWGDDQHVAENRAYYAENFRLAEEILSPHIDFSAPPAGFFLWLNVGDGMKAARKLWEEAAIKTVPGELMAREDETGSNPGASYLRVALVYDAETTKRGLLRLVECLFGK
ncbi:MAG: aspartate aminotransferase [Rhodospirillaceae bacterium]|nr:aspartate aminotransferase [Rhodospirillaceae bacterium]